MPPWSTGCFCLLPIRCALGRALGVARAAVVAPLWPLRVAGGEAANRAILLPSAGEAPRLRLAPGCSLAPVNLPLVFATVAVAVAVASAVPHSLAVLPAVAVPVIVGAARRAVPAARMTVTNPATLPPATAGTITAVAVNFAAAWFGLVEHLVDKHAGRDACQDLERVAGPSLLGLGDAQADAGKHGRNQDSNYASSHVASPPWVLYSQPRSRIPKLQGSAMVSPTTPAMRR